MHSKPPMTPDCLAAKMSTALECRRRNQTKTAGGNEMDAVRNYFNTEGFGRWQKIYGDKDDVSKVGIH